MIVQHRDQQQQQQQRRRVINNQSHSTIHVSTVSRDDSEALKSSSKRDGRRRYYYRRPHPAIAGCLLFLVVAIAVVLLGLSNQQQQPRDDDGDDRVTVITAGGKSQTFQTKNGTNKQQRQPKRKQNQQQNQQQKGKMRKKASNGKVNLPESQSKCTIWLAASSLKGHPGMGVFTTRSIAEGEKILRVNDGLTIPLYNVQKLFKDDPNLQAKEAWLDFWQEYIWEINKPDHISYESPGGMSSYAPCYSSLTNHHCLLSSLRQQYPTPFYDDSIVLNNNNGNNKNLGAGAFTYDIGRENIATRTVEPGEELFLNYLFCEHDAGGHTPEWAEQSFMPADFKEARQATLEMIWSMLQVHNKSGGLTLGGLLSSHPLPLPKGKTKLVQELLPKTMAELAEMRQHASTLADLQWYLMKHKGLQHYGDPDWVRANGICLENFIPQTSPVPHAGRGGIAQWKILKGEIVAPAPLLQIMDQDALIMYSPNTNTAAASSSSSSKRKDWSSQVLHKPKEHGKQLLLNYCFGHSKSTLLLCPQSNVVLLNHCSSRPQQPQSLIVPCPNGPNAAIQWASPSWHKSTESWLKMSLDKMAQETTGGLAFDVVALRDIDAGEEIFIDYGPEWEDAWEQHALAAAAAPPEQRRSISAKTANDQETLPDTMMSGNLRQVVNHPYLFTGCEYRVDQEDAHEVYSKTAPEWKNLPDEEILELYSDPMDDNHKYVDYARHRDYTYWPCSVLLHDKDNNNDVNNKSKYVVRIHQSPFFDEQPWQHYQVPRLLTNFDRKGIHFFVKPNKSDHMEQPQQMQQQQDDQGGDKVVGVFRHKIGIPDDMFPEQWKNLKQPPSA